MKPLFFWDNTDPNSLRAYKFLYENKIEVKSYEVHDENAQRMFDAYRVTSLPVLVDKTTYFVGADEIKLCNL